MARIRTASDGTTLRVTVSGRLMAVDMGRLEHACSIALLTHPCPLELDVREVTATDRTAVAVVARMMARGARIIGTLDPGLEH